jgi:hypothetical protein
LKKLFGQSTFAVMRTFLLAIVLLATGASAQTTVAAPAANSTDPGWLKVETLELGKRLHVNTKTHTHIDCLFGKADDQTLTCGGVVFKKEDIQSIKPSHRLRSTFVGLGVGYGSALAVTAIAVAGGQNHNGFGTTSRCNSIGCATTIAFVDLTLVIATPIVFHVYDLTSTAIYKAP